MVRRLPWVTFLLFLCTPCLPAQEEKKKPAPDGQPPFQAPQPKALPMPAPMPVPQSALVIPYQRTDTREVWQYYAPSRLGRMAPRVIMTPYGSYYSRDLAPYPWAGVNQNAVLPIIVD